MATGATYLDRKLAGIAANECVYPGCKVAPADDSMMCVEHRDGERLRVKTWMARKRIEAKKRKLCRWCFRRPLAPGSGWGCGPCLISRGEIPAPMRPVTNVVNKRSRVASRITVGSFAGEEGRSRYRGALGRKGRPGKARENAQDMADHERAYEKFKAAITYAESPEVKTLPLAQRKEVERAALSQADHGIRFLENLLERYGYERQSFEPDDEE